jgi:hypothetical protein
MGVGHRACWEAKADFLVRFTSESVVLADVGITEMPLEMARAIAGSSKGGRAGISPGYRQS